jgi:hypothetical protein
VILHRSNAGSQICSHAANASYHGSYSLFFRGHLKKLCCSIGGSEHFWTDCRYLLKANVPLGLITARISGDTGPLNIFSTLDISKTPEEFPALLDSLYKPVEASVEGGPESRRCTAINPPICMRRNPREYLERNIPV